MTRLREEGLLKASSVDWLPSIQDQKSLKIDDNNKQAIIIISSSYLSCNCAIFLSRLCSSSFAVL